MASNFEKKKDINYLSKDFSQFRKNLVNFVKTYYPDTYNDFNEASPGMMFLEMAAYVGDVLSYYIDDTLKESLLPFAQERRSVNNLAQFFGYKVKPITPATVTLDVFQLVPAIGNGKDNRPDYEYALTIKPGMEIEASSDSSIRFKTEIPVDFSFSSSFDPTTVTVYSRDGGTNDPLFYLLKKQVKAYSGREITETFTIGDPAPFPTVTISDLNVVDIVDVMDADGNRYYEVPFLAQDYVFTEVPNIDRYDDSLSEYRSTAPFLLRLLKTPRRFVTRLNVDGNTEIQFGAGISDDPDQILVPNPKNIGLGENAKSLSNPIDPQNFYKTSAYGKAPYNTTLTVKYIRGNGLSANVNANDLTNIRKIEFDTYDETLSSSQLDAINDLKQSIRVNNAEAATGGKNEESLDNIRNDAIAHFASQNRAVTKRDYEIRSLSLPARFGNIAKVYVVPDGELNKTYSIKANGIEKNNPFAVNMYVLGYDQNKKLTSINKAVKQNLKNYLSEYRMITDGINIIDGFVINIGVDFVITTYSTYNKQETLLRCIERVKEYFNIDRWTFNQPINLSEIELEIGNVDGVSSVQDVSIKNLAGGVYSQYTYNIKSARRIIGDSDLSDKLGKIIYPSLDPMIFEVKYPNKDIRGRVL